MSNYIQHVIHTDDTHRAWALIITLCWECNSSKCEVFYVKYNDLPWFIILRSTALGQAHRMLLMSYKMQRSWFHIWQLSSHSNFQGHLRSNICKPDNTRVRILQRWLIGCPLLLVLLQGQRPESQTWAILGNNLWFVPFQHHLRSTEVKSFVNTTTRESKGPHTCMLHNWLVGEVSHMLYKNSIVNGAASGLFVVKRHCSQLLQFYCWPINSIDVFSSPDTTPYSMIQYFIQSH